MSGVFLRGSDLLTNHYYSSRPDSKTENREIIAELRGKTLTFRTDAGVFSKKGIDFGSRLLIETAKLQENDHILDLGCGYGPIGIALAAYYSSITVKMVDVNKRAVHLASENARLNQVEHRVQMEVSDGFSSLVGEQFDAIMCNPPIRVGKTIIYQLFEEAVKHLNPKGSLWIVIRKQQGAASAQKQLATLFSSVELIEQRKGYCILQAKNI